MARNSTIEAALGEIRDAQGTAGGLALSTTLQYRGLSAFGASANTNIGKWGAQWLQIAVDNQSAAGSAALVQFGPWLTVLKTQDTNATFTDYSLAAQDNDTGTDVTLSSQDTLANGDALYVGSHQPFRGAHADVDSTNSTGSRTLTVATWQSAGWVDASATDGTSGTTSLDQDGSVTWAVPALWKAESLNKILTISFEGQQFREPLYWTRWTWNGALDASVTLNHLLAIHRSSTFAMFPNGSTFSMQFHNGFGGLGSIEARTDAGTADLMVNVGTLEGGGFRGGGETPPVITV